MSTSLLTLTVDEISAHPKNVRRDDTPDAELIASVESQGILQPLVVVPAPDDADTRYWLLMGHRRLGAARAAALTEVPAIVREDLAGEAEQIEAMLVENGRRADLTPVEEADAYQQLTLLGVDVDEIAKTTGRSKTTVKERLRLAQQADKAKEAVHAGQITLEHASALADLEEDHELYTQAVAAIGTTEFRWTLDRSQRELTHRRDLAARIAAFEADGLPEIEMPDGGWGRSWMREEDDKPILLWNVTGLTAGVDYDGYAIDRGSPYAVVSGELRAKLRAAEAEDEPETDEQREAREAREREQAEFDARHKAREALRERHAAARTIREQSIRDAFAAVKLTKAQTELLRAVLPHMLNRLEAQAELVEKFGLEHDGNVWSIGAGEIAAWLARKPAHELLSILTIVGAVDLEEGNDTERLDPADDYDRPLLDGQLAYLGVLGNDTKHPFSQPDIEWRNAIVARLAGVEAEGSDD